jgi:general secretion pathway protein D
VESLIVEVNKDKAAEFGIQWQNVLGTANSSLIGFLGSNFSASVAGQNIINIATQNGGTSLVPPATGFNIGVARNIDGRIVLSALARFFERSGDANVLSTPNLMTLDNEEAKIVVGSNVPFVTGQFTNTGASGNTVNPFQTIERKDVGLTLRVKPQIADNGTVRLTIYQETSSVDQQTRSDPNGPTTSKRTIETNVMVEDGQILVIGGLLQDQYGNSQEKVPGIGDVPLLGALFRTEARNRTKSNLMVFLRPVVIRDRAESDALSLDRYDLMRTKQQNAQPVPSAVLKGVDGAPVMPEPLKPVPPGLNTWSPLTAPPATTAPSAR